MCGIKQDNDLNDIESNLNVTPNICETCKNERVSYDLESNSVYVIEEIPVRKRLCSIQ